MDIYMLPFAKGTDLWVTQGNNSPYSHYGKAAYAFDFNLSSNDEGALLVAAADGTVDLIKEDIPDDHCGGEDMANQSNRLVIRHDDGFCDLYLHLKRGSACEFGLSVGTQVVRGQPIARMGKTGYTNCRAHLHFQRQYCGTSYWQQSVPVVFADVPGDGVPKEGRHYVSANDMAQPASLRQALQDTTDQQAGALLTPAHALLAYAQHKGLGAALSGLARLTAPDGQLHYVQVFEGDTAYLHVVSPGNGISWTDAGSMNALLAQNAHDAWGLALWQHTYSNVGVAYRPSWASHQYALRQLASNPLGVPLGGGSNGVHTLLIGGKRYESEIYARDTIYWIPPNWEDIRRLSELDE